MGERVEEAGAGPGMRHHIGTRVMGWRAVSTEPETDIGPVVVIRSGECLHGEPCWIERPERAFFGYSFNAWRPDEWMTDAWLLEERVKELGLLEEYGDALAYLVMDSTMWSLGRVRDGDVYAIAHATPEQRCRAALRAVEPK